MGKLKDVLAGVAAAGLLAGMAACTGTVNNPSPKIASLNPPSTNAGVPGFNLVVNGHGFAPTSEIELNGSPRFTLFLGVGQLQTMLFASDVQAPQTVQVTVFTPQPGGGTSNEIDFVINPVASPIPMITSIMPSGSVVGGISFTMTVMGAGFVPSSVVTLNGNNEMTSYDSSSQLRASILTADLGTAGSTLQVAVLNPPPGGGLSNHLPFVVDNPTPILNTFNPTNTTVGASITSLDLVGSGFTTNSVVNFGNSTRTGQLNSTGTLTIPISASDLASAGVITATVTNPAPGGGTSNAAGFGVNATSTGGGLPQLADIDSSGIQAVGGVDGVAGPGPSASSNGEFIAFTSAAGNLITNLTNNQPNVFLHDTCLGQTSCAPKTVLVSQTTTGTQPNAPSGEPAASPEGRWVTFTTAATNLVNGTGGFRQIYERDACAGTTSCVASTFLATAATDGTTPGNGDSFTAAVGTGGRFLVFVSQATNLLASATSGQQVFLRDTCVAVSGCTPKTSLVSTPDANGTSTNGGNAASFQPAMSPDGRFVVFASTATNLAAGATSGAQEIFLRDTCTGVSSGCTPSTKLVSVQSNGSSPADGTNSTPSISSDGRFVGFASNGTTLVTGITGGIQQIYLRDMTLNANPNVLVSAATDNSAPGVSSSSPNVSSTGRFVAFSSLAANLVASDTNGVADIFVRDTCAAVASGCTPTTKLASVSQAGAQGNGPSTMPVISSDGKFVVFLSAATNLVAFDTNLATDVFLAITSF